MKKITMILAFAFAVSLTGFATEATGTTQNLEISKTTASVVSNAGKSKKPHGKTHKKGSKAKKARK